MKRILLSTIFVLISCSVWSQIEIANTETPEQLILNTFLGENISISNIKFNGSTAIAQSVRDQIARYSNGAASLSSEQGLILATGKAIAAIGPNNSPSKSDATATPYASDPDLYMLAGVGASVNNACKLEFDFVPNGNTVLFEYIFASEEYSEFVNSQFNDVFGLFLSGPGIIGPYTNGAINIAIIPETLQPVSINTLNNGNANAGPCSNCQYYIGNGIGNTPAVNTEMQYDGRSSILTASGAVNPGETYHLKFAIANIADNLYDSAMFLTQGSFRSSILATPNFQTQSVKIFPNPASDFIQISLTANISEVAIYDLQGRALMQKKTEGTNMSIDTTTLQAGTYIVEFASATKESTRQKLVIQ